MAGPVAAAADLNSDADTIAKNAAESVTETPNVPAVENKQSTIIDEQPSGSGHGVESSDATVRPENAAAVQGEGSLATTLTGTQTSRQKAQQSSSSEKAKPNGSTEPKKGSASVRSSKSLLSRIVHILLPCIPSASQVQDPEPPKSQQRLPPQKEKQLGKIPEKASPQPSPPGPPKEQPASADSPPLTLTTQVPPEADVILPPTPVTQILPEAETEGMTSGAVVPPGSTGVNHSPTHSRHSNAPSTADDSDGTSFTEEEELDDVNNIDEVEDEEDRLIMNGGAGIPIGPDGVPKPLLPPIAPQHVGRKCLVLDLDETLVHSSFKSIAQADYVVPVEIEYHWHNVYVIKRPGVDNFLKKMGEIYEVVVFTASLSKYADPVLDKLDIHQVVTHRLFRESCYNHRGNYVKDLSQLGRPIADTIILDNSPASYIFHPNNAVPVSSWFNDPHDTELTDLVPFLADLGTVEDVRGVLDGGR